MKIITLTVALCIVYPTYSHRHAMEKHTEATPDIIHVDSTLQSRFTRAISEEDTVTGYSKEYDHSNEVFELNPNKAKISYRTKQLARQAIKVNRLPRESSEDSKRIAEAARPQVKAASRTALVKKPIPKFNEIDYDDDFQTKVIRSPGKYMDSGEHEDEDFNLDDYDFDVNHDEFVGRGKPLEPRQKIKNTAHVEVESEPEPTPKAKPPAPVIKIQSKLVIPTKPKTVIKREHTSGKLTKKAADKMKEDYYDDITSSSKAPEVKTRDEGDDSNEETDDSKEFYRKPLRAIRSPWVKQLFTDKVGEKSSGKITRLISDLPMFPQTNDKLHYIEAPLNNIGVLDGLLIRPLV